MNKNSIVFFIAMFLSSLAYAGDSTHVKLRDRFYAGVSFTPGVSYRLLSSNCASVNDCGSEDPVTNKIVIDERNHREKPGFGFEVGFKAGMRVTKFMSVELGVNYVRKSYWEKMDNLQFGSQWNGSGYDSTDNGYYVKFSYDYHFINIPVGLNFNFGKGKVKGIVNLGASFDVLIAQSNRVHSNIPGVTNGTSSDMHAFNRYNLSPFLGVGIEYHVCNSIVLRIMPTAQMQALKSIDAPVTEHLWSAGVNASLFFTFVKNK